MDINVSILSKDKISHFIWQHILLLASLFLMTLGVALCVRSHMGSSVISSIPMAFTIAGEEEMAPGLTLGGYTNLMNMVFVVLQWLILRSRFEKVQLFQLVIGFLFGALIDINMYLTSFFDYEPIQNQILAQFIGCTVMAAGISAEIRCGSVTMPGEGIQVAVSKVSGLPFAKVKIIIDTVLVGLAVLSCYVFFGEWLWNVIGPGTLFAMFYIGFMVKVFSQRMSWFDRLLGYRPGFRRYIYGLARFIYSQK